MVNKNRLSKIVTIIFLGLFAWYATNNTGTLKQLGMVSIFSLLLIAVGRMIVYLSNALFTKWTAEQFVKKMPIGETIYLGIISAVGNFFGPLLGGTSIRAVYLKKVHNLTYSKFASTLISYYLILFSVNCVIAIVALLFLPRNSQSNLLLLFFTIWLLTMIVFSRLRLPKQIITFAQKRKLTKRLLNIMLSAEEGWQHILKNKTLLIRLLFLSLLSVSGILTMFAVEFNALNISISLPGLLLYTSLVTVALLVSITPGAIGIRETILLVTSSTIGITNEAIIQAAVLDRGVVFSLLFVLFLLTRSKKLMTFLTKKEVKI